MWCMYGHTSWSQPVVPPPDTLQFRKVTRILLEKKKKEAPSPIHIKFVYSEWSPFYKKKNNPKELKKKEQWPISEPCICLASTVLLNKVFL